MVVGSKIEGVEASAAMRSGFVPARFGGWRSSFVVFDMKFREFSALSKNRAARLPLAAKEESFRNSRRFSP